MATVGLGLFVPVLTVAGIPGQILVNGQYGAVNGNVVIGLDGPIASGVSGFNAQIAATGQALVGLVYGGDSNLSGSLVSMSGQLVTQIQSAAGVLSLNNATGLLTLTSAPANANYVKVTTSGTTILISGDTTPLLTGISLPGGGQISGTAGSITVAPTGMLLLGSTIGATRQTIQLQDGFAGASYAGFGTASTNGTNRGLTFYTANGECARFTPLGTLLVNTPTDFLNGAVQLATHTTSGGGIGLGPDNSIWRLAANSWATNASIAASGVNGNAGQFTSDGFFMDSQGNTSTHVVLKRAKNTATQNRWAVQLQNGENAGDTNGAGSDFTLAFSSGGLTTWTNALSIARVTALVSVTGIAIADSGNYTANRAASVAQLLAASGWLTNSSVSNVVYTTGNQSINGIKTFLTGVTITGSNPANTYLLTLRTATPNAELIEGVSFSGSRVFAVETDSNGNGFLRVNQNDGTRILSVEGDTARVGIGTGSPAAMLDVNGASIFRNTVSLTQPTALSFANGQTISDNSAGGLAINSSAHKLQLIGGTNAVDGIVEFQTNNTVRMVVASSGNVGIGTTAPAQLLHVSGGNVQIHNGSPSVAVTATNAALNGNSLSQTFVNGIGTFRLGRNISSGGAALFVGVGGDYAAAAQIGTRETTALQLFTNDAARITIDSNGLVGIGTTGALALLHVSGGPLRAEGPAYFGVTGGNVGIGTTNPAQKLDVAGNLLVEAGNRTQCDTYNNAANSANIIYRNSTNTIVGNGSALLVVQDGGNVGVNTTTPSYKLEVSGSFGATTKSFDIPHGGKPGYRLIHGVTEGPHHSVFLNGALNGSGTIEFPPYWSWLVREETIRVQVTPLGRGQALNVSHIAISGASVDNEGAGGEGAIRAHWRAEGVRKDVPQFVVEQPVGGQ